MISIGVVGLGFGQRVHIPALRKTGRFHVAGTSSRTQGDWKALLQDPTITALSIAIPPKDQYTIALAAIERGKALFLEKPLSLDLSQASILCQKAKERHVPAVIDFEFCILPEWLKAKELLDKNFLGPIESVHVHWHLQTYAHRNYIDTWKRRTREGGGALFQFGSHVFHYLEWLVGPIQVLSAKLSGQDQEIPQDDQVTAHFDFEAGAKGSLSLNTNTLDQVGHVVEIYGRDGFLKLENRSSDPVRGFHLTWKLKNNEVGQFSSGPAEASSDGRVDAVAAMAERFADWIEKEKPAKPSWEEGLRVQMLLDAALKSSSASGARVSVEGVSV